MTKSDLSPSHEVATALANLPSIDSAFTPEAPGDYLARIVSVNQSLAGWCIPQKAMDLAHLILRRQPAVVVELGVFGGRSLLPQIMACSYAGFGVVYGIDAWSRTAALEGMDASKEQDRAHIEWWGKVDLDGVRAGCSKAIEALPSAWSHTVIMQGRSELIAPLFKGESIDVLHIDGNHTELASCRDVRLWFPRVKPGGFIWFDDAAWASVGAALGILVGRGSTLLAKFNDGQNSYNLYRKDPTP